MVTISKNKNINTLKTNVYLGVNHGVHNSDTYHLVSGVIF